MTTTDLPTLPDFRQMELECKQLTHQFKGAATSFSVTSQQELLYTVPRQLELKVTNPDQNFDVFFETMNLLITKDSHYGLFQQTVKEDTQSSFYLVSPNLLQLIEDNRDYYEYRQWVKEIGENGFVSRVFRKKDLRDKSRYYSSARMDSTSKKYYTTFMENHYHNWAGTFKSFNEAHFNISARLIALITEEIPQALKEIEINTLSDLLRRLSVARNCSMPSPFQPPQPHIQFLTKHT